MNVTERRIRSNNKVAAVVAVTMILGVFVAISHHPVGNSGSLANAVASISRLSALDQLVHGAIMVMLVLLCAAMTLFSKRLGQDGFAVIAANGAYAFGVGLALIAMGFDGFVLPALADRCAGEAANCADGLNGMFTLSSEVVQAFTRLAFISISLAIVLWSAHLAITERKWKMAVAGLLSAAVQFSALATVAVRLTPHSMLFVLLGQLIWYCVVAIFLWTDGSEGNAQVRNPCDNA